MQGIKITEQARRGHQVGFGDGQHIVKLVPDDDFIIGLALWNTQCTGSRQTH